MKTKHEGDKLIESRLKAEREKIVAMHAQGASLAKIMRKTGRTAWYVDHVITHRPKPPAEKLSAKEQRKRDIEEILRRHKAGESLYAISESMDRHATWARRVLKASGIDVADSRNPRAPWDKKELKILHKNYGKMPLSDLAKLLPHRVENAIYQKAKKEKLT